MKTTEAALPQPGHAGTTPSHHMGLTTLRALACLMVVALHTAAPAVVAGPSHPSWGLAQAIDAACRACVPLFFMLTGYLFFHSKRPTGKHMARLVAALALYSLFAVAAKAAMGDVPNPLKFLFHQTAFYHLWYFYAAMGVYAVAMLVRVREDLPAWSCLAAGGALLAIHPQIGWPLGMGSTGNLYLFPGGLGLYVGYACMGAGLRQVERLLAQPATRCLSALMAAAGIGWTWFATERDSQAAGMFVETHYGYGSLGPMLAALGLFVLFVSWRPTRPAWNAASGYIARRSLAIYGLHAPLLAALFKIPQAYATPALLLLSLGLIVLLSVLAASILVTIDRKGWVS